jgi:hypothetical protein
MYCNSQLEGICGIYSTVTHATAGLKTKPHLELDRQSIRQLKYVGPRNSFYGAQLELMGARRRRNNGSPGGGCARMHVGTHPNPLVVGVGNLIVVRVQPGMAARGLGGVSRQLRSLR